MRTIRAKLAPNKNKMSMNNEYESSIINFLRLESPFYILVNNAIGKHIQSFVYVKFIFFNC